METQKTLKRQSNLEKRRQMKVSGFPTLLQSYNNENNTILVQKQTHRPLKWERFQKELCSVRNANWILANTNVPTLVHQLNKCTTPMQDIKRGNCGEGREPRRTWYSLLNFSIKPKLP